MYEVEVKAKVRDRDTLKAKLDSLGCKFGEEMHQIDYVFFPKGFSFPPPIGTQVLRVRKQNDKYFFTLKISQSSRQDAIEREMEISNGPMMIEIMKLMELQEAPTVNKRRIKTNYKDMEIVLDIVEELGEFIEVEKIVTEESGEARQNIMKELFTFLNTLGVGEEDHVIDGKYDIMLFEKNKK